MCEFCENFDFSEVGITDILGTEKVCLANGSYKFPPDQQFIFCPRCGRQLRSIKQPISERDVRNEISTKLNNHVEFNATYYDDLSDTIALEYRGEPFVLQISKPNAGEFTTPLNYLKYLAAIKDAAK